MATEKQRSRRQRAIEQIQKRIDFWSNKSGEVEFDGKIVNASEKQSIAEAELRNIMAKVR